MSSQNFSPTFTSWAQSQSTPCEHISNFRIEPKKPLKLSGNINWEARNEQIHEYHEMHKGQPEEGQPIF